MKKKKIPTKIIKKSKEEYQLIFAQDQLKHKKMVYETYIEVLVKYNISSIAYSAIMYDDLYSKELLKLMEKVRDNNKSILKLMFGIPEDRKLTEVEKLKKSEEYYDKLINLIENRISMFDFKTKMKIAKDAIEKFHQYLEFPKIERELRENKKDNPKENLK